MIRTTIPVGGKSFRWNQLVWHGSVEGKPLNVFEQPKGMSERDVVRLMIKGYINKFPIGMLQDSDAILMYKDRAIWQSLFNCSSC